MTGKEAKMILDIDSEDLELCTDRFEELMFQQVNFFFRDPILVSLSKSRLEKMKLYSEAFLTLQPEVIFSETELPVLLPLPELKQWKDFFYGYERNKAMLRKEMNHSHSFVHLSKLVTLLGENERDYSQSLLAAFQNIHTTIDTKISEAIQIIELVKECENLKAKGWLDDTMVSFEKLSDNILTFNLSKEINRLRKIGKNG